VVFWFYRKTLQVRNRGRGLFEPKVKSIWANIKTNKLVNQQLINFLVIWQENFSSFREGENLFHLYLTGSSWTFQRANPHCYVFFGCFSQNLFEIILQTINKIKKYFSARPSQITTTYWKNQTFEGSFWLFLWKDTSDLAVCSSLFRGAFDSSFIERSLFQSTYFHI